MNWGMKIVIGLSTFITGIALTGVYMVMRDTDTLVEEDYYERSLEYDQIYNRKQNTVDDEATPLFELLKDTLIVRFSHVGNTGTLFFKKNSNSELDKKIPFHTVSDSFKLPISSFDRGNWTVEISWDSHKKDYFVSHSLDIK